MNAELIRKTPSEAEAITGLSVTMQIDWRKRGFLPKTGGHARFDCFDLAEMTIRRKLSDFGIGPKRSALGGPAIAFCVAARALHSLQAFECGYHRPLKPAEHSALRTQLLRQQIDKDPASPLVGIYKVASEVLPRFFVWWQDDLLSVGNSIDELIAERNPGAPAGPAIFLDINAEATDLLRFGELVSVASDGKTDDPKAVAKGAGVHA